MKNRVILGLFIIVILSFSVFGVITPEQVNTYFNDGDTVQIQSLFETLSTETTIDPSILAVFDNPAYAVLIKQYLPQIYKNPDNVKYTPRLAKDYFTDTTNIDVSFAAAEKYFIQESGEVVHEQLTATQHFLNKKFFGSRQVFKFEAGQQDFDVRVIGTNLVSRQVRLDFASLNSELISSIEVLSQGGFRVNNFRFTTGVAKGGANMDVGFDFATGSFVFANPGQRDDFKLSKDFKGNVFLRADGKIELKADEYFVLKIKKADGTYRDVDIQSSSNLVLSRHLNDYTIDGLVSWEVSDLNLMGKGLSSKLKINTADLWSVETKGNSKGSLLIFKGNTVSSKKDLNVAMLSSSLTLPEEGWVHFNKQDNPIFRSNANVEISKDDVGVFEARTWEGKPITLEYNKNSKEYEVNIDESAKFNEGPVLQWKVGSHPEVYILATGSNSLTSKIVATSTAAGDNVPFLIKSSDGKELVTCSKDSDFKVLKTGIPDNQRKDVINTYNEDRFKATDDILNSWKDKKDWDVNGAKGLVNFYLGNMEFMTLDQKRQFLTILDDTTEYIGESAETLMIKLQAQVMTEPDVKKLLELEAKRDSAWFDYTRRSYVGQIQDLKDKSIESARLAHYNTYFQSDDVAPELDKEEPAKPSTRTNEVPPPVEPKHKNVDTVLVARYTSIPANDMVVASASVDSAPIAAVEAAVAEADEEADAWDDSNTKLFPDDFGDDDVGGVDVNVAAVKQNVKEFKVTISKAHGAVKDTVEVIDDLESGEKGVKASSAPAEIADAELGDDPVSNVIKSVVSEQEAEKVRKVVDGLVNQGQLLLANLEKSSAASSPIAASVKGVVDKFQATAKDLDKALENKEIANQISKDFAGKASFVQKQFFTSEGIQIPSNQIVQWKKENEGKTYTTKYVDPEDSGKKLASLTYKLGNDGNLVGIVDAEYQRKEFGAYMFAKTGDPNAKDVDFAYATTDVGQKAAELARKPVESVFANRDNIEYAYNIVNDLRLEDESISDFTSSFLIEASPKVQRDVKELQKVMLNTEIITLKYLALNDGEKQNYDDRVASINRVAQIGSADANHLVGVELSFLQFDYPLKLQEIRKLRIQLQGVET